MSDRTVLALVGGFLGSGKTTLIFAAARELQRRGVPSALIMNDQGYDLVDTEFARANGFQTSEVTGGCFCCRSSELVRAANQLRDNSPRVIFAEPVGSCTDVSATILQPFAGSLDFQMAPLTVLVDPARAASELDDNLQFLFQKQIDEADIVCFTKSDLYPDPPELPGITTRQLSAKTGQGVAAWLDDLLSGELAVGTRTLDIDYAQYARAEAALTWLNLRMNLNLRVPLSPAMLLGPLLERLDAAFTSASIRIVHMKAIDETTAGMLKAATCENGQDPVVEGALDASPAARHELLLNLRAVADPKLVRKIVEAVIAGFAGQSIWTRLDCFQPAAPVPERHILRGVR
jgi:hypothetical protein